MLPLFAAIALTQAAYSIPQSAVSYKLDLGFDGYIPILGGNEGTVDLKVGITVKGLPIDASGNQQAVTDLSDLKIIFNGATLPFGKDQVEKYFPNTVTLTPQGKVIKNNAPEMNLPVQLPGLDIKRFPDITFLAIEFPTEGVEVGKEWGYSRTFGSSDVRYTVKATSITDAAIVMDISLSQTYGNFEDEAHNLVKDPKDAVADVSTQVSGGGHVTFDRKKGLISKSDVSATAVSTVTDLKSKQQSKRNLKTHMLVSLSS